MIGLLAHLFIKNPDNYKDVHVREKYGLLCGGVGIFFNILLFAAKFAAGLMFGSISVSADAFNNLGDAGSSLVTLIGFKMAGQEPDTEHPFGHGRIEYLSGMLVSIFIMLMAYELIKSSIAKLINPTLPQFSYLTVAVLVVSILVKLYMFAYNRSISKKIDSKAMSAVALDSISDVAATLVVLICTVLGHVYGVALDGAGGLLVGLFILYTGIEAMKETVNPLLGTAPDPELVGEVEKIVLSRPEIMGIHDMVIHDYGPGRLMISLHAEVPANMDILLLHEIIDSVEFDLRGMLDCEPVIHMDPVVMDDEEINAMRKKMGEILNNIDPELKFHDFRMVKGTGRSNLIFDVLVPHGFKLKDAQLKERIAEAVTAYNPTYYTVIQIDHDYVK